PRLRHSCGKPAQYRSCSRIFPIRSELAWLGAWRAQRYWLYRLREFACRQMAANAQRDRPTKGPATMLEPDQWDSALSRARGPIYHNTERISSNAVRPLHSKYFRLCDPHPITENRIDAAQRAGQACDAKRIAPFPTRSTL